MDALEIVKDGATAAGFAKVLIDVIKMTPIPSPSTSLPILAFVASEVCAFLLFWAGDAPMNRQSLAITVLVGIAATGGAVLASAFQTKADKVDERIDAALSLKPGSTVADVEKKVNSQ